MANNINKNCSKELNYEEGILESVIKIEIEELQSIEDVLAVKTEEEDNFVAHNSVKTEPPEIALELESNTKLYSCRRCPFKSRWHSKLKYHKCKWTIKTVRQGKIYQCSECDYSTVREACLHRHQRMNHPSVLQVEPYIQPHSNLKHQASEGDHVSNKHTEEPFVKCAICNYTSISSFMMKHIFDNHTHLSELKWLECDKCDYKSTKKREFATHLEMKHSDTVYNTFKCIKCTYKTNSLDHFSKHVLIWHNSNEDNIIHYCDFCSFKFNTAEALKLHIRDAHPSENQTLWFNCPHCSFRVDAEEFFVNHVNKLHISDYDLAWYTCELCPKSRFMLKGNLMRHIDIKHGKKKNEFKCTQNSNSEVQKSGTIPAWYICNTCSYKAKTNLSLQLHIRAVHPPNSYSCNNCDYKAESKSTLNMHIINEHTDHCGKCKFCDYTTELLKHMTRHIIVKHNPRDKRKTFECKKCDYITNEERLYIRHRNAIHSKRSFKCEHCAFTTKHLKSVKRHELLHCRNKSSKSALILLDQA